TIRIWEQRYNFLKPSRTSTNIRTYSNEELKEILTVALLNKYGYKISKIDNMLPAQRHNEVLSLQNSEAKTEYLVNTLLSCMIDLDIAGFEKLLNKHIEQHSISTTITTIIFQFLEKVGILWQTSRINPAHEHIVTNIIRQKIIAAIEGLPIGDYTKPLHLLFLPEDQFHELGLLFVYYLLKEKGLSVIYLGANVPLKDVKYIIAIKQPQHVYVHLTSIPSKLNLQKFITAVSAGDAHSYHVAISGYVTEFYKKSLPSNVSFLKSFSQVLAYIATL
ncbi:MAG TPA: B12-binding domain-containing protein, partial [Chitinophagaceae bacterium]|nr:B12-binding domain-containing protein [Chitinophagaceae bacterium]